MVEAAKEADLEVAGWVALMVAEEMELAMAGAGCEGGKAGLVTVVVMALAAWVEVAAAVTVQGLVAEGEEGAEGKTAWAEEAARALVVAAMEVEEAVAVEMVGKQEVEIEEAGLQVVDWVGGKVDLLAAPLVVWLAVELEAAGMAVETTVAEMRA